MNTKSLDFCRPLTGLRQTLVVSLLLVGALSAEAQTAPGCGNVREMGQESDYRTATPTARNLVESFHFTAEVEALLRGKSGHLVEDIAYTLRWFPNHHRALVAMSRLGERLKVDKVPRAPYSVDCYFQRAISFAQDDTVAHLLYASYLFKAKRVPDANRVIEAANRLAAENAFTQYNIGLVLLEAQQFDRAVVHAQRAAALGFPRDDLKTRLKALGHWREAPAEAGAAGVPASEAAPATASASASAPEKSK